MPDSDQGGWFPLTKLDPPRLSSDILNRSGLLNRLYQAVTTSPLTLLSAPAGAGKTTAIVALREAYPELPMAWVSLDADDADPSNFLALILAAVQSVYPHCSYKTHILLTGLSRQGFDLKRAIGVMINDILDCAAGPLTLVLDDFHLVGTPVIHEALNYLLDRRPPELHLVIMTRHDPSLSLSRLRVRGQLAEFRAEDLGFTGQELHDLLNGLLHLNLSTAELALLQQRTEGWAAGVRLLSLSLSQAPSSTERAQLITHFSQSHRFIFDYLIDEVLRHLEPDIRLFLLETSILSELMPVVCQAVTGRADAETILDDLYRRNLFLVMNNPAGAEIEAATAGPTYRYHALFGQFLRRQLSQERPDRIRTLHRLAAEASTRPAHQIHHYLAAHMWPQAAAIIQKEGQIQLEQSFIRDQVVHWIDTLPEAIRADRPWLQLTLGAAESQRGDTDTALPFLEKALAQFTAAGDDQGIILTRIYMQAAQGGLADPALITEIDRRLEARPELVTPLYRVYFHIGAAWIYEYRYRWQQVEEHLFQAFDITLSTGDLGAFQILAQSSGPQFLFTDRGMAPVEQYARATLDRFGDGNGLVQMGAYNLLAQLYLYQGRLEKARQAVLRVEQISERLGGFGWVTLMVDHVLLANLMARGDYPAVERYLQDRWPELEQGRVSAIAMAGYLYLRGRSLCLAGQVNQARQVRDRMASHLILKEHRVSYNMLHGLVALAEKQYETAEAYYREAVDLQIDTRHTVLSNRAQLGLAHFYLAQDREEKALAALDSALTDLDRRGMPGVVLQEGPGVVPLLRLAIAHGLRTDFVRQTLAMFEGLEVTDSPTPEEAELCETELLSVREMEVLTLLAEGMTNREIADRLVIAPSTVKRHTINIYNKLTVGNRTQAVARARELGLL